MTDQADALRGMIRRAQLAPRTDPLTIAVAGKGGVGCSVIAVNLAAAAARTGKSVGLAAAGRAASLERLSGRSATGVRVLRSARDHSAEECDLIVLDVGNNRDSLAAANYVLLIATPDPAAIAEAYAMLKSLPAFSPAAVVVNQADTESAAQTHLRIETTARRFLERTAPLAGVIPICGALSSSIVRGEPVARTHPTSPSGRALIQLAARCLQLEEAKRVAA